ncbi:MAG: hypothetical protein ACJAQT_002394 [Akkermansiaceae bacterium]
MPQEIWLGFLEEREVGSIIPRESNPRVWGSYYPKRYIRKEKRAGFLTISMNAILPRIRICETTVLGGRGFGVLHWG